MNAPGHKIPRGFTLIELITVVGLIAFFAGAMGWALCNRSPMSALESGQRLLAVMFERARSESALARRRTSLVIDADPTSDEFLRRVHVVVESATAAELWEGFDRGILLPAGIYVIPQETVLGVTLSAERGFWAASARSNLEIASPGSIRVEPRNQADLYAKLASPLGTAGGPDLGGGDRLVLGEGSRSSLGVKFTNPSAVRGVILSAYGVAVLINEAAGFVF
ncbi:MAG: hypothetical protein JWM32_63 [Verrucomicrobia bacterium]|nr:hypothetical protein [Verrucomicrobiota bacterium]